MRKFIVFLLTCTIFVRNKNEARLRSEIKKQAFVFLSTCTIFGRNYEFN